MEPLILPTGGLVYVDANAIIYSVERVEPYHGLLAAMWEEARAGRITLSSSEIVALETLIRPLRDGNARLEMLFRSILASAEMNLIPANLATWEDAARIRAETGPGDTRRTPRSDSYTRWLCCLHHQRHRLSPCRRSTHRCLGRSGPGVGEGMTVPESVAHTVER